MRFRRQNVREVCDIANYPCIRIAVGMAAVMPRPGCGRKRAIRLSACGMPWQGQGGAGTLPASRMGPMGQFVPGQGKKNGLAREYAE